MLQTFKSYASSKLTKQTLTLSLSQALLTLIGAILSILHAKILGPKNYGILSFFITITGFFVLFFRFGFFSTGSLLLTKVETNTEEKELIGALTIICSAIGITYALFFFFFSTQIDDLFKTNLGELFKIFAPLLIVLPFRFLIAQTAKGTNNVYSLAFFRTTPKALYLIALLSLLAFQFDEINTSLLIFLNLLTVNIVTILIILKFKPQFTNLKNNLKKIFQKNKEYGRHIYVGQLTNQITYKLDGIFITYFINTTQLGFYTLASAATAPMIYLSQSLNTSLFKKFSQKDHIPKKILYLNFLWLLSCTIGIIFLGPPIIKLLFGEKFLPVIPLILPLALASFFQGMYQPYGFITAKGKGKWVRNIAFIEGFCNVTGNIILIYIYGTIGAAIASAISKCATYLSCVYYYNRFIKQHKKNNE